MFSFCIAILCFGASAYSPDFYGAIGENTQTFTLRHLRSGAEIRGALLDRDTYISELSETASKGKRFRLMVDTPWAPDALDIRTSEYEINYESTIVRVNRLEEGWRSAGYQLIDVAGTGVFPVQKAEKERAERANALLEDQNRAAQNALFDAQAKLPEIKLDQIAGPGFIQLWGGHIAVCAAGLLAMAGVWYYLVIRF